MTLEEFGQKVAACSILSDTEIKYVFMSLSGAKPPKELPFKSKKRTANFQWLEFPANSVSTYRSSGYHGGATCTVASTSYIKSNAKFEISEVQFCQPTGQEKIDQVDIDGVIANSVKRVQNKMFKGYPVYKASFEKAFECLSGNFGRTISFTRKNGLCGDEQFALVTAGTINHKFTVNGQQISLSLQGYNNTTTWQCLTALKIR